ncbi:MAG: F0F1 ATP synthase assembly protein I [Methylococcales symbiont of Hymedesmia sp. n. MRB-2018]|nr:MAG: F0F1 ATP synthase assembly protein I [Methylococcales symbiont of Hymedesmia sp. n. MRB-2018]KAF3984039.1 MAG: F0F1 ATP synthase assembly protein I [Methylococcales symbiont of Hymedesmia sp. n. MRB-2018]
MTEETSFSTVNKILLMQALVIVIASLGLLIFGKTHWIISSLLGGLIAFIPNLYFAYRISLSKGQSAKKIVRSFYSGESKKILMTCVLFAVAFQLPNVQFFPLMVCFVAVLSVFWLALILFAQDFKI